jgi:hypothetical protein
MEPMLTIRPPSLRAEERAAQVCLQRAVPIVRGHLEQRFRVGDAGIVDEDVDPAEARQRRVEQGLHLFNVTHVAALRQHLGSVAQPFGQRVGPAAGDDRDPPRKIARHPPIP